MESKNHIWPHLSVALLAVATNVSGAEQEFTKDPGYRQLLVKYAESVSKESCYAAKENCRTAPYDGGRQYQFEKALVGEAASGAVKIYYVLSPIRGVSGTYYFLFHRNPGGELSPCDYGEIAFSPQEAMREVKSGRLSCEMMD